MRGTTSLSLGWPPGSSLNPFPRGPAEVKEKTRIRPLYFSSVLHYVPKKKSRQKRELRTLLNLCSAVGERRELSVSIILKIKGF